MEKIDRKEMLSIVDTVRMRYVADIEGKNAVIVAEDLDDIKDFCKNREVKIYRLAGADTRQDIKGFRYKDTEIVFRSRLMERTIELIESVAGTDTTVLIEGETGVGKGMAAKLIHRNSCRHEAPFMDINCAAIPEKLLESELFGYEAGSFTGAREEGKPGLFEAADGGTVFLDEINSLPMPLQVKLLRVIQEREVMRIGGSDYIPVDVRILAASNVELLEAVSAGTFREDLYYRLNVVPIVIPPLRDRKEDIRILGESFLRKCNAKYGTDKILSEDAWKSLEKYRWPGNVRELENIIERVVIVPQGDVVDQGDIREMFSDISADEQFINPLNMTLKEEMNAYEKKIIESRMASCKTTKELARKLGIDKSTLTRKMNKLNIRKK